MGAARRTAATASGSPSSPCDHLRQARHGDVRPGPGRDDAGGADGRHPGGHGRRRQRAGRCHGRVRGRATGDAVRRRPSRTHGRADPAGRRGARATDDEWPWGESTRRSSSEYCARCPRRWGRASAAVSTCRAWATSVGRELAGAAAAARCTPAAWAAFARMAFEIDVRHVVPAINVPTLILHAVEDQVCHVENARFLARTIRGARTSSSPGGDHVAVVRSATSASREIREFLTGRREAADPGSGPRDGALHRPRRLDRARRASSATGAGATCSSSTTRRATRARPLRRPRGRHRGRRLLRDVRRARAGDPVRAGDRRGRPTAST